MHRAAAAVARPLRPSCPALAGLAYCHSLIMVPACWLLRWEACPHCTPACSGRRARCSRACGAGSSGSGGALTPSPAHSLHVPALHSRPPSQQQARTARQAVLLAAAVGRALTLVHPPPRAPCAGTLPCSGRRARPGGRCTGQRQWGGGCGSGWRWRATPTCRCPTWQVRSLEGGKGGIVAGAHTREGRGRNLARPSLWCEEEDRIHSTHASNSPRRKTNLMTSTDSHFFHMLKAKPRAQSHARRRLHRGGGGRAVCAQPAGGGPPAMGVRRHAAGPRWAHGRAQARLCAQRLGCADRG